VGRSRWYFFSQITELKNENLCKESTISYSVLTYINPVVEKKNLVEPSRNRESRNSPAINANPRPR